MKKYFYLLLVLALLLTVAAVSAEKDTLTVLSEHPERLTEIPGIRPVIPFLRTSTTNGYFLTA